MRSIQSKLHCLISAHVAKRRNYRRKSRSQRRRQLWMEGLETRLLLASDLTIATWDDFKNHADNNDNTWTLDNSRQKVTIGGDLSPGTGASLVIRASEVVFKAGVDTCSAPDSTDTSNCGSLDIEAHKSIIVDPGVTLNAKHATTTGTDGDITLHVKNDMAELGNYLKIANQLEELIAIFDQQRVHVSIGDDVRIQGGKIDISTDSGNFQIDKYPWLNDQAHKLWKMISASIPVPSALIGVPITFQDWAPESVIQVGSGAVDIDSTANSGLFSLKITAPDGSTKSTSKLSRFSTAQTLQLAINELGLPNISVTVTGDGTVSSPWHVNGLGINNVQVAFNTLANSGDSVDLNVRAAANTDPSITDAHIVGSKNVTIEADAYASAIGKAVNSSIGGNKLWGPTSWSVGMFLTNPTASIDLHSAVVSSQQDVSIATSVDNTIGLTTKSLRNTGAGKTNTKVPALSFALSEQKTTSTIFVDENSLISGDGAVSVTAAGSNDNSTSATAAVYRDGTVGLAPAVSYGCGIVFRNCSTSDGRSAATNVTVTIDGDITANVSQASTGVTKPAAIDTTFSPAFHVNIPASKVTLPGTTGYQTGDAVVLTGNMTSDLPGLDPGLYYLIVTDNGDNSYDLQFAATAVDALANKYLSFGTPYPMLTDQVTGLSVPVTLTATDNQQRSLILFGYDKGPDGDTPIFNDGDKVTFHSSGGRFLGYRNANGELVSLTDGATYQVQLVKSQSATYPLTIQLLDDTTGASLDLYGGSFLESDSGVRYPISAIDTDSGEVDLRHQALDSAGENIVYAQPILPVAQGEKLIFHSGLSEDSASLQEGKAYWAIVDPNNPGLIQLAISAAQAEAADPSVQDALAQLTAIFQGVQIPLDSEGKPNGLAENQEFQIQLGDLQKQFIFTTGGVTPQALPAGAISVLLVADSAEAQAAEIVNAINGAMGLHASYQADGRIAVGAQPNLVIQSSSALQVADVPVNIPIDNFESGVGLVFSEDPNVVDNLRVTYHAVPGKPMAGLVDGGAYYVYNVNNGNYNPAVPQFILTLMNAVEISSAANGGSFALRIATSDGSTQTTSTLPWNVSADDLAAAINGLGLPGISVNVSGTGQSGAPWYIDGLNVDAVTVVNSSLKLDVLPVTPNISEAAPEIVMGSDASDGTFTLKVRGADGSQGITGDLPWNLTAAQLQAAIAGLKLTGVNATVEGSGTSNDRWLIRGLNPSQIVVDSGKLLSGQDPTYMQMTSARQVAFDYGQTLEDAGGTAYPISGADRNNGTLTIVLTETAPVVAADGSQLTGDGVGAVGVSFEKVPDGAFEFYSFAASGKFTLTVTDSNGTTQTSSDIPYNASPDQIAAALNALAGVAVTVTGLGTISSPWMVSGLSLDQVTADSNLLDKRGDATNPVAQATSAGGYRVWVDHAQGGTFALTLHAAGQDVTTAALSFDVDASDLTSALRALAGVNAQVTGAGTSADPWILHTWSRPIYSGDPLVFHDSWGMPGLGMIDGRTYYAIVLQQGFDPQEITLQLAATPGDAANASSDRELASGNQYLEMRPYLPFDPAGASWFPKSQLTMLGVPHSSDSTNGITIAAKLDASNSVGSYANLGGFPLLSFAAGLPTRTFGKANADRTQSWIEDLIQNSPAVNTETSTAPASEFVGAAAMQWVSNNVQVIIGRTAEIGTDGPLAIFSQIDQSISAVSNAGLSKTTSANTHRAAAVSFALTNVQNTSQTLVSSDAVISGGRGVDVNSHITNVPPAHWPILRQLNSFLKADDQSWKRWIGAVETAFTELLLGDLGLLTANFNTVANVGIARVGGKAENSTEVMKWVVTGSFAYEVIHNDNLAQIADGAKVNVPGHTFTSYNSDSDQKEATHTVTLQPSWPGENATQIVGFKRDSNGNDAQFYLSYQGHDTTWLYANASAAEVQNALQALPGIGQGNVIVTQDPADENQWHLTFVGDLANANVDQVIIRTKNIDNVSRIETATSIIPVEYGVSIVADTETPQWGLAGQLYFSVPYMIHGLIFGTGERFETAWREGGPFRSAAKNALGGSVSLLTMDGSTQALLGGADFYAGKYGNVNATDATEVHYGSGSKGGLRIEATTTNGVVQVAEASANSSGFGFEGSVAYVAMGEPHDTVKPDDRRQQTYAKMISRNAPLTVEPLAGSLGDISVNAADKSFGWAITGAIMLGQTYGVGLSGSVVELTRDVQASIGSQYASNDPYLADPTHDWLQELGSTIQSNGSVTVHADVAGKIEPISLVGAAAVRDSDSDAREEAAQEQDDPAAGADNGGAADGAGLNPLARMSKAATRINKAFGDWQNKAKIGFNTGEKDPEGGFFISGDFSGAFIDDTVFAYVNVAGTLTGGGDLTSDTLAITSENSTTVNPIAGSFALQLARPAEESRSSGGFAGSVAWASVGAAVESWLDGTDVSDAALEISADNNKLVHSWAAGLQVDSPTGFDLQVAGSIAINTISNTTRAAISDSNATNLGSVSLKAFERDAIHGYSGTGQFVAGLTHGKAVVGVGMSMVWNETNNTTLAEITGSTITQVQGDMQVVAEDFTTSDVASFGAQVAVTTGSIIEIGGMWTANLLFPNTTAQLFASNITGDDTDSNLSVSAALAPILTAWAGYFSVGVSAGEEEGQLGIGVASVTTRIGSKADDNSADPAEYQTLALIADSTVGAFSNVTVYALSGDLNVDTKSDVPDQSTSALSDEDLDRWNIQSLAIAGGAQIGSSTTIAGQGASVSTRQHVDTIARVDKGDLEATGKLAINAINQLTVQTDAGGVAASISYGEGTSVALGFAPNDYHSQSETIARVENMTIDAGSASVNALLAPYIENYAFGVAVSGSTNLALGGSGAYLDLTQEDAAKAGISNSAVTTAGGLAVNADDESFLRTWAGSGTLAIGGETAGVAAGGVSNFVRVRNDVLAWLGAEPSSKRNADGDKAPDLTRESFDRADTSAFTVGGKLTVQAIAGQTIKNTTYAVAISGSGTLALAGSGASAKINLANIVIAGINSGAQVIMTGTNPVTVEAYTKGKTPDYTGGTDPDVGMRSYEVYASVGDVAAALSGEAGGSIGVSLGLITNDDLIVAQAENSAITTKGGTVEVAAWDDRNLETNVWVTSIAFSLDLVDLAAAGGHSFIYSQPNVIAEVGHGTSITPADSSAPGDLTVTATGQEQVHAGILGGVASVILSVGDMISEADKHGTIWAGIGAVGTMHVNGLTVQARGDHDLDAHGWSYGVGGIDLSFDDHRITYDEHVMACMGSDIAFSSDAVIPDEPAATTTTTASANGAVTLSATSSTTSYANAGTRQDGNDNHTGEVGGIGVGVFHARATFSPIVHADTTHLALNYGGNLTIAAEILDASSQSRAVTASGSVAGGDATDAFHTIAPDVKASLDNSDFEPIADTQIASQVLVKARTLIDYDTYADTISITLVGGAGARVFNTFKPASQVVFTGTNYLKGQASTSSANDGNVTIVTYNDLTRDTNDSDKTFGAKWNDANIVNSSRGGGGGLVAFDAASIGCGVDASDKNDCSFAGVQHVGYSYDPSVAPSGTFTLTYNGQTTDVLAWDADAKAVKDALTQLNGITASVEVVALSCTASQTNQCSHLDASAKEWQISFDNSDTSELITINTSRLSGSHVQPYNYIARDDNNNWTYDGTSRITLGDADSLTIEGTRGTIDVSVLVAQKQVLSELASQDTGSIGVAYAKNFLGLALTNQIALSNLTASIGIGDVTIATAVDVDTTSSAIARANGIAEARSFVTVGVTISSDIELTKATMHATNLTIQSGDDNSGVLNGNGQFINDAHQDDVVKGRFAAGINVAASSAAKSDIAPKYSAAISIVEFVTHTLDDDSSISVDGNFKSNEYPTKAIANASTAESKQVFGNQDKPVNWNHATYPDSSGDTTILGDSGATVAVLQSDSLINDAAITVGSPRFDVAVNDWGLSVNGTSFSWNAPDSANPIRYQDIFSTSNDSTARFSPFSAAQAQSIDAALGQILDTTSLNIFKLNFQASDSTSKVAYILQNLVEPQGSLKLVADHITGTGTVSAYAPKLSIVNNTSGWLILDGIASHTNPDAGKVSLLDSRGNWISAPGLTIHADDAPERSIAVSVSEPSDGKKPFMIIAGYLDAPSSSVTLTNDYGPIIELAPIHAASVTINVPNSAFAVYTPDAYFGTGGNSQLAFENAAMANALDPASSVNPSSGLPFLPGLTRDGTDTKYDANYVAVAASDYGNGTSNSRIPILASGPSSVIAPHLGSGITAAQIAVFAKTIDINAPLTIGRKENLSVVLSNTLGDTLRQYRADYNSGLQSNPLYAISLGDDAVQGFGDFVSANTSYKSAITTSQITLTDGSASMARAAWYKTPLPTNDDFTLSFTYQASGNKQADGVALAFQTQGTSAIGGSGGNLGYVGINGQTAAYEINLFKGSGQTAGSTFVTANTSGTYNGTGHVDFSSGHRIRVTLAYDAARQQVIEGLTDLDNSDSSTNTYTHTYSGINLAPLGTAAYVGFTGASGGSTSVQTVSDFSLLPHQIVNRMVPGVTATYDARANQITLSSIALTEQIRIVLDGAIISTIGGSQVSLIGGLSGQGIQNQTGIPLVLNNIDAGPGGATGTIEFRDTLTQINTRYVYSDSGGVAVYTAPRGQNYATSPDDVRDSQSVDFQPQPNVRYSSYQQQDIFKTAAVAGSFTNAGTTWYPNGDWSYGDVAVSGFTNFQTVNATSISSDHKSITLTTSGTNSAANAAWLREPIDVTRSFMVSFHYDCNCSSSDNPADGIALALQTAGTNVVGASGGGLGYSTIGGNKAAFMINLYDYKNNPSPGVSFDDNETWNQAYTSSTPVTVYDPIDVQLYYDASTKNWTAFLTNPSVGHFSKSQGFDFHNLFGSSPVYLGFTGSTGKETATQVVSDLLLVYDPQSAPQASTAVSQLVHVVNPPQPKTIASVLDSYNTEVVYASGTTFPSTGGFDQAGNAYDYEEVQTALAASTFTWHLGPQNASNAWRAQGQTLTVPSYLDPKETSYLNLLGSSSNGPQTGTFTLHYADGSAETWSQSFSDWWWNGKSGLSPGELVQGFTNHANQSTGSQQAATFRLYSYSHRLKDGTALVSIDLPNDSHIVLLGVNVTEGTGFTGFVPAGALSAVSVSGSYDTEALYAAGTTFSSTGGFDQAGRAYDYRDVQSGLAQSPYAWTLGPQTANNAWRARGQTLTMPAYVPNDTESYLNLLGATNYGPQSGTLTLHYADGSTDTWTQSFSDWWWNGQSGVQTGESIQGSTNHANQSTGSQQTGTFRLYSYSHRLKDGATLVSIDLPVNSHIVLLGISLSGTQSSNAISSDAITFSNSDDNHPRAVWYSEPISTDVDTLSMDFTYQASLRNPTITGFGNFVARDSSYASAVTANKITLTDGSQNIARAAWYDTPIQTTEDFDLKFNYQSSPTIVTGFSSFVAPSNTASAAAITSSQITLTDGSSSIAHAAWLKNEVPINGFTVEFTYQAGGAQNADGVALVFQTQGTDAIGGPGGALGYVGIAGKTVAYEINIFGGNGQTKGTNFVTSNTSGTYNQTNTLTGGVNVAGGDPIKVRLVYDAVAQTISEELTDTNNNDTYTHTYSNIDLLASLGTSLAYIGFTGASGGKTAIQTVTGFSFQSHQADGIALVFQNQGTNAKGSNGGGLGYVGIQGATAAYQINVYSDNRQTSGSNFVTTNTSGTYNSTGNVDFTSGHQIQVELTYDSHSHSLTERLTDSVSNATYTHQYANIDLEDVLGATAYLGFTGGSGGETAVQIVESFSYEAYPDDGIALVFQSAGTNAVGGAEHGLGYVGISGPTAAYQIHLESNGLKGSNFVTTNTADTYNATGAVDFTSGHPIHVQLQYNTASRQLTETLNDLSSGTMYTGTYSVDLASVLGPFTYFGFTVAEGGPDTKQSIADFSFLATSTAAGFKQRFAAQPLSKSISDGSTTSYATDLNTWLRADNPIRVDFSGMASSALNVMSNASLTLNGLIRVGDIASLTTTSGSITTTSTGSVSARTVSLSAEGGGGVIGTSAAPVNVSLTKTVNGTGYLSAEAANGIYVSSPGSLTIGYFSTSSPTELSDAPVVITAGGDILTLAPPQTSLIYAGTLSLSSGGTIGSSAHPLQVQLVPNTLASGSIVAGLLNAQAAGDMNLVQVGDVRLGRVITPGTVAITTSVLKDTSGKTTSDGNLLDGLTLDALELNDPSLSPQMRKNIYNFLTAPLPDNSDETIAELEQNIDSNYLQYWQLIPVSNFPVQPPVWNNWDPGDWGAIVTATDSDGNPQQIYQLTATGIAAFRPQVALAYQENSPTDSEVQDYANQIWQRCVATFASTDAFGPDWASLPSFQQYDPNFSFTASDDTVATIKAAYQESFNLFSFLSSEALAHRSVATAIAKTANIQAGNLILKSSGSIGQNMAPVDIPLDHFQNNALTPEELQLVRFASQAGELQLIGTNAAGQTIYYDAGSPPENVTLTGVRVAITRPLLVQVAPTGSLTANSSSELLVLGTAGDLRVNQATSSTNGSVWLASAHDLMAADGSTGANVSGGALRLDAGNAIGASTRPLKITAAGRVDLSSLADASLESTTVLPVGVWNVQGAINLQVDDSAAVTDALASQRSSFAGFNTDGTGWTATASQSTQTDGQLIQGFSGFVAKDSTYASAITASQITLTDGVANEARATWLKDPIPTNYGFTAQFTYQASGNKQADGVALVFQTQGTNVVGNSGGSLGYVGIAGPTAAYEINIYAGHTIGSAFVTTNTSGTYHSTGNVNFASGHPIQVTLTYDVQHRTLTESLKDLFTNQTYAYTHGKFPETPIDLGYVLHAPQAYIGFSGGSGGATAIQTVKDFTLQLTEPAATVSSPNSDDQLTLTLHSATNSTVTWPSQVAFAKNDPVQLSDQFTFGFLYQSSATGSRVALDLSNTNQMGLALVLNLGNADGSGAWADFVNSSQIATATSGQSLGSVLLNSNHPIEVTITYSLLTQTVIATLTDTVTNAAVSIQQQNVNLIQRLGGRSANISWQALGDGVSASTHTIHGFRLIDGPVNLTAGSLNVMAGGAFGVLASGSQPSQPILLLIGGETQIHAGAAIVAEQVLGNLEVGAIVSPTTVAITAPFGAVEQYVPPTGSGSGANGEPPLTGVIAPSVNLTALYGIGQGETILNLVADQLSAIAGGDVSIYHQALDSQQPSTVAQLLAGGKIDFYSNGDLSVTGAVVGQQAAFHSSAVGKAIRLALAGLRDNQGGPLAVLLNGFAGLNVDDAQATEGHSITVAANTVSTPTAAILLGVAKALGFFLGSGDDHLAVLDASGLNSLEVNGGDGDDQIDIANAALAIKQLIVDGKLGDDVLNVDLKNTGAWVVKGGVETTFGKIDFTSIKQVVLDRLEEFVGPEAIEKLELEIADFPTDRLLVVGTTGADAIALQSQANGIKFTTKWNGVTSERRTYDPKQIKQVQMYLLGDDDFLSVTGSASLALDIYGGRGNDWIYVSNLSATITDLHGDNIITTGAGDDIIHTGPGDDEIEAGGGQNQITDDGGTNLITTGGQNDQIHHANIQDWILAGTGVNDIWLNGVHQGWHNALKPADVNHDGVITPLDAILVINLLNALGGHVLAGSADSSSNLYDTSADGFVAPLDALLIINELNFYVGEGETSVPSGSEGAGEEQLQRTGHIEIAPLLLPLDNPIARATTGQQQQTVLAHVGIPTEYRDLAIVADRHKNSELSVDACFADSEADEPFWCELIHERTTVKRNRLKAR